MLRCREKHLTMWGRNRPISFHCSDRRGGGRPGGQVHIWHWSQRGGTLRDGSFTTTPWSSCIVPQCQWRTGRKIVVQDCWRSLWGWICTSVLTARIWCFLRVNPKVKMKIFLGFVFSLSFFTVFKCHSEPLEVAEGGGTFCSWCHGVIPAGIPHWCSDLVLF